MRTATYPLPVLVIILISSCSSPNKSGEEAQADSVSLAAADSGNQAGTLTGNIKTSISPHLVITELLTEGTYLDGQLPPSTESGNWYALMGKEGGISETLKVELSQARTEPSEGEDFAPITYISTIPETVNAPVILFNVQGSYHEGAIKGRVETRFVEPESTYALALPGFLLRAEGISSTNEEDETSYEQYGLMLEQGDRFQQLYSGLSFSSKTPSIVWSGDLNADGIPDLLFESSVDPEDMEAHYQLWLSDSHGDDLVILVAEQKIYPGA